MKVSTQISLTIFWLTYTEIFTAPTVANLRQQKTLNYFGYSPEEEFNYVEPDSDYQPISRTIPTKNVQKPSFNSPIYYIRLPPQPYVFVPGLGYVSQPAQPNPGAFLNVPVSFVSNGKPGTIYQWNGAYDVTSPPKIKQKPKPKPKPDSVVHRLPGKYVFNGKPNDVFVLQDQYGFYNDALNSFYP